MKVFKKETIKYLFLFVFILFKINCQPNFINKHFTTRVTQQQQQTQTQQQKQDIYGIRWFLGDYWKFSLPKNQQKSQQNQQDYNNQKSQQLFILMFNSRQDLDDQIYLKIQNTRYGCYQRFLQIQSVGQHHYQHNKDASHKGENFTNYLYKCIVNYKKFKSTTFKYQIISGWAIFQGEKNQAIIKKFKEDVLFQGVFRIPQNIKKLQMIFAADWGLISQQAKVKKGYKDIMPSLIKSIQQNSEIGLIIFGGDLAYDLQTQNYIKMLKYLQPITSQMAMLVTPGNHQSVYHQDSFQLFVQSFYTPMWYEYFNYFTMTKLQKQKMVIIGYDPQKYVFENQKEYNNVNRLNKDLEQVFRKEITQKIADYIKQNYDVIVFSHYPIYCSYPNQHLASCDKNQYRFKQFIKKFEAMGLDLYISGHLHSYQRTKQICNQNRFNHNNDEIYDKSCPIYVVQGDAGNQDYVAMKNQYQLKNYSKVFKYGTGYSLIRLDHRNITLTHYNIKQADTRVQTDKFTLFSTQQDDDIQIILNQKPIIIILQGLLLIIIICLAFYFICKYIKVKVKQQDQEIKGHIEMIQENFEVPAIEKQHNPYLEKDEMAYNKDIQIQVGKL